MGDEPLLRASDLRKSYTTRRWLSPSRTVDAVRGVDLQLSSGSKSALVGQSGSGKSTLVRCLACLEEPDSGEIWFEGKNLLELQGSELRRARRGIQLVFQHSATALNPALSAVEAVAEPLLISGIAKRERRAQALAAMVRVGVPTVSVDRSPLTFSGGERQRLSLARALIVQPKLLILDEPFSGLDSRTRDQIAELLIQLQALESVTYLFVLHDLEMAAYLADTIFVIEGGRIVESGQAKTLFVQPQHAATAKLIASIPRLG